MTGTDIGTITIGRLTMTDDAVGSLSIMLTNDGKEKVELTLTIDSGTAQAAMPNGGAAWPEANVSEKLSHSYEDMIAGLLGPGKVDTRVFTPTNFIVKDPAETKVADPTAENSTPEPATTTLFVTSLGTVLMRRQLR